MILRFTVALFVIALIPAFGGQKEKAPPARAPKQQAAPRPQQQGRAQQGGQGRAQQGQGRAQQGAGNAGNGRAMENVQRLAGMSPQEPCQKASPNLPPGQRAGCDAMNGCRIFSNCPLPRERARSATGRKAAESAAPEAESGSAVSPPVSGIAGRAESGYQIGTRQTQCDARGRPACTHEQRRVSQPLFTRRTADDEQYLGSPVSSCNVGHAAFSRVFRARSRRG